MQIDIEAGMMGSRHRQMVAHKEWLAEGQHSDLIPVRRT